MFALRSLSDPSAPALEDVFNGPFAQPPENMDLSRSVCHGCGVPAEHDKYVYNAATEALLCEWCASNGLVSCRVCELVGSCSVRVPQHLAGLVPEFHTSITCSVCGVQPSVQACNNAQCAGGTCREAFCGACLLECVPCCDSFRGAPFFIFFVLRFAPLASAH